MIPELLLIALNIILCYCGWKYIQENWYKMHGRCDECQYPLGSTVITFMENHYCKNCSEKFGYL